MSNDTEILGGKLAIKVNERLDNLGMSKRELSRRTGLSRQTIHNIVNEGSTNLKPSTFDAIDTALKWDPGTSLAFALGADTPKDSEEKFRQYLSRIAVHLSHMSTQQLELTLIMLEENELGASNLPTTEFTRRIGILVESCMKQITQLIQEA